MSVDNINSTDNEDEVSRLIALLEEANTSSRKTVLKKLGAIDDPRATKVLVDHFYFANSDIQACALQALNYVAVRNRDDGLHEWLVAPVAKKLRNENRIIRREAAGVLSNLVYASSEPPLMKTLLTEQDVEMRDILIFALGKVGSEKALPLLEDIAQHDKGVTFLGHSLDYLALEAIKEIKKRSNV